MKQRIEALTSTRAVAAIMVVIFHYGCTVFPFNKFEHFFRQGNIAVGYFFVLSGFVMYCSYADREVHFGDFLKRRIARIMPLYWFAVALGTSYTCYRVIRYNDVLPNGYLTNLLLNISTLQAYVPGQLHTINPPGWSLSVEMFFYLLFPAALWLARKDWKCFVWVAVIIYVVSLAVNQYLIITYKPAYLTKLHDLLNYHPLTHLNQFLVGIVGAGYSRACINKRIGLPAILVLLPILFIINYMPSGISMHNGLIAPLFVVYIIMVANRNAKVLNIGPFIFIGEVSYGIYLLQDPVHFYCIAFNNHYTHLGETSLFYMFVVVLFVIAVLAYFTIEIPLKKLILHLC